MIRIRPAEDKDIEILPEFLSEGFPDISKEIWKPRFEMWWKENPSSYSFAPQGWVLEKNGSEIVGFMGNIPVRYQINGKIGNVVASSSWYVRPEFQGIWSIKLIRTFLKQPEIHMYLFTTPCTNVEKMLKKLGFSSLDLPFNKTEYWYLLDMDRIFNLITYRVLKSHKILTPFMKISSIPIKLISRMKRNNKKINRNEFSQDNIDFSTCTHCDESFTELWEKNRKANSTTLSRDAENLNWLYFADAVKDRRFVIKCTEKRSKKLLGYFAFDLNYYEDADVKILKLKDAFVPEINEQIALSFLSFSQNLAKNLDASAIRFWAIDGTMEKILKKKMKIRRKFTLPYYYKFEQNVAEVIRGNKEHIFIPSPIDPNRGIL